MSSSRLLLQAFGLTLIVLLLTGCGGEPAQPTATPTPTCALECDIDTESYSIGITCESGPMSRKPLGDETTSSERDSSGNTTGVSLNLNRKRTYENTQNAYTIVGTIEVDLVQNTVDYEIVVTGGAFGDTPQTCTPEDSAPTGVAPEPTVQRAEEEAKPVPEISPEPTESISELTPTAEYLLQDDFSDPTSGWDVSTDGISERKYQSGEYIMRVGPGVSGSGASEYSEVFGDCYESWSLAGLGRISDIAIDVDARYIGGAEDYGAFGIIFYYRDKLHFYYDQFYPNWGMWERAERNPSGYYMVIDTQDVPDMRIGQSTNHVRLEISESLKLYINGELVSVSPGRYQAGQVGFWAESCTDEILEVAFDNVVISKLP